MGAPFHVIRVAGAPEILRSVASRAVALDLRSVARELAVLAEKAKDNLADHSEIGRIAFTLFTARSRPAPAKKMTDSEEQHRGVLYRASNELWSDLRRIGDGGPW